MMILQNILHPSKSICNCKELYCHQIEKQVIFDGYFNIFSALKWHHYTEIDEVSLVISVCGAGEVTLYSEKGIENQIEIAAGAESVVLRLPTLSEHYAFWFGWEPLTDDAAFIGGMYITDRTPKKNIHLAADICTYRREAYVRKNIEVLKQSILENELSPLYSKFDLYLIDNGQTLHSCEFCGKGVHLFSNINAGGSGGFTRGLMEIQKASEERGYTHVIFLDDDAVIEPDAFIRTYALLSFLKDKYQGSVVGGAMLDIETGYLQNESGALYNKKSWSGLGHGIDLRRREEVLKNEKIHRSDYAGWWYACYPLSIAEPDNLPLPFFIHVDDVEYGVRNELEVILLNGICIWHGGFNERYSQAMIYYETRNMLVTNALRLRDWSEKDAVKLCFNTILVGVFRYLYNTGDLVLQAVEDFLLCPDGFMEIDPVKKNSWVREHCIKMEPIDTIDNIHGVKEAISKYAEERQKKIPVKRRISRNKYLLTLNGWIFPARRCKKDVACYSFTQPDMSEIYREKYAYFVDPYAKTFILTRKSYCGMFHNIACYFKIRKLLHKYYQKTCAAYRKEEKRLESTEYWRKYLHIEEGE